MKELTKDQVQVMIFEGIIVHDVCIKELDLYNKERFESERVRTSVVFENCFIEKLDFTIIEFFEEVVFRNCSIGTVSFHGAYFYKGITIENCIFNDIFYFDCGGHNENPYPVQFINCVFNGFVDFFDAWFMGPVIIKNCKFIADTNLLCDSLAFEVQPILEANEGNLSMESTL